MNRYLMLGAVLLVSVGLDQWTKGWADASLGTIEHPLPLRIAAVDAGKALGDVIQDHFGLSDAERSALAQRGPAGVALLYQQSRPDPAAKAFRWINGRPRLGYYWVFHHRDLATPPRRMPEANNQLRDLDAYGDATLHDYLRAVVPYLGPEALDQVLREFTFPVVYTPLGLSRLVEAGETYLLMYRPVHVIPGFFQLRYAENPGAAWGLLSSQSQTFRRWFFLIVSILALIVLTTLFVRLRDRQRLPAVGFALILSGAIGNFIDRIRFNFVIDFFDMYVGPSHWPTFNVADIAISVGVGLLLLEVLLHKEHAFLTGGRSNSAPVAGPQDSIYSSAD